MNIYAQTFDYTDARFVCFNLLYNLCCLMNGGLNKKDLLQAGNLKTESVIAQLLPVNHITDSELEPTRVVAIQVCIFEEW